ncbi:hypothetical protein BEP19_00295 [Ammoniphilus oxalaticus]|uniref:DUF3905 domain-containing protein n=1 Tax=Ammoniphilus oxalaticus TaxID=66863 RepID=A0A419SR82_9BACL|nr:DUF3905 domain-containing protein [Ammoniphilus oxalaticus]RKD27048.1 hypothetical protein BEP19_00295 [Ammoniphilus oxalaticus]
MSKRQKELEKKNPHQIHGPSKDNVPVEQTEPFVNEFGVVIGDHFYDSAHSPLNNWNVDVDPAIMAGDQWVHPTNDIGWNTAENQELLENGLPSQGAPFMHPTKDVGYRRD